MLHNRFGIYYLNQEKWDHAMQTLKPTGSQYNQSQTFIVNNKETECYVNTSDNKYFNFALQGLISLLALYTFNNVIFV